MVILRLSIALFLVQAGFHAWTASLPLALARAQRFADAVREFQRFFAAGMPDHPALHGYRANYITGQTLSVSGGFGV